MSHETRIEIDPDLPCVRIIREFDATPAQVFRAHADPELFVRWVGPECIDDTWVERWDARAGGEWRYRSNHAGYEHWFRGCFHDVREGERIVQTFTYEGFPDAVSLETMDFQALDGGRCRLVSTSMANSFEERDAFVASGMEHGVREGYLKLDSILAG
ncbi:MAG: SRPBCC domain-containing protein [Myxococcota bacterium]